MAPQRIQLSRAKGWRMPQGTVKVDRSTAWGNPFNATQCYVVFPGPVDPDGYPKLLVRLYEKASLSRAIDLYTAYLRGVMLAQPDFLKPLRGKNLACWCAVGGLCHADVLLRLANGDEQAGGATP